jgi:formate hydrogenlyase subunit 3/multisubunit Na+/H+ antiporter MnhD subunit
LGIVWRVDGPACVFVSLNTLIGVAVGIYSFAYFGGRGDGKENKEAHFFWPLWMMLWSSLYALFLSRDIFNWYVTLELSGLAAVAAITLAGSTGALRAAMRYLLLALCASLFYLAGTAILYASYGTLDVEGLRSAVATSPRVSFALALMATGLCVKAALFPLHFWLPSAHSSAPSPVSAVLSALVVKGGFYILLRLMTDLFPHELTRGFGNALGAMGAAAILWGSFHAVRQRRLKLVIAYSTVAQLGYLFVVFPLMVEGWRIGGDWASRAWAGGIYHALSHGLAKASLFLAAGIVIHSAGDDRMETLEGLGDRMPMTVTGMALAGVSLMGVPPGAGFIAKWAMLTVAVKTGLWEWAATMIVGGLAAVAYLLRIFRRLMSNGEPAKFHPPPRSMEWMVILLASLSIFFGFSSVPVFSVLIHGAPPDLALYFGRVTP